MKGQVYIILLGLAIVIGSYIWFISKLVGNIPALKEYKRYENISLLDSNIKSILQHELKYNCVKIDTISRNDDEPKYILTVDMKFKEYDYKFIISYFSYNSILNSSYNSKIELIGAYDFKNKVGGFHIDKAGMEDVIGVFEQKIIAKLR
ncbi:hypothetical protein DSL64_21365 [Dyadobacter luteus]|uniref:Uncharacterized protein n=1 Tax=Dyadobacter luteus TaxID=2259619 RepID=A0A3D8Y6F3_9BACT|nr:hypothetical protein [Dyadobacter luteus]REA58159.1 hypothetical protein DSL64_21365 [Dyadobacter luteus]